MEAEKEQYAKELDGEYIEGQQRHDVYIYIIHIIIIKKTERTVLRCFYHAVELSKPKPRRVSTETLRGIQEVFKRTEEEKRRLELESQLYKRWRPGSREESIILSSRSNNEALAKMNWLDKQVKQTIMYSKSFETTKQHSRL